MEDIWTQDIGKPEDHGNYITRTANSDWSNEDFFFNSRTLSRGTASGVGVKSKQQEWDLYVILTNCGLCGRRGYVAHVEILSCTALAEVW